MVRSGDSKREYSAVECGDGHRTGSVFDRYNIIDESDLIDASVKLEQFLAEAIQEEKVKQLQK